MRNNHQILVSYAVDLFDLKLVVGVIPTSREHLAAHKLVASLEFNSTANQCLDT